MSRISFERNAANVIFDLWMILHKKDCIDAKTDHRQELSPLNNAEHFENLAKYKQPAASILSVKRFDL